jgi:hypothetical protein
MFDQLFEGLRKASEFTLQAQQDMFKQWAQVPAQWPSPPLNTATASLEWTDTVQKRWRESTSEVLNKHRELLDAAYASGIQMIEQTFRISEAKSPEDYRRLVEELWRKLFESMSESFKEQSETQLNEFQKMTEKWAEMSQRSKS